MGAPRVGTPQSNPLRHRPREIQRRGQAPPRPRTPILRTMNERNNPNEIDVQRLRALLWDQEKPNEIYESLAEKGRLTRNQAEEFALSMEARGDVVDDSPLDEEWEAMARSIEKEVLTAPTYPVHSGII